MKVLAVDTALGACSVALIENNEVIAHRLEVMQRGHAERLAPMVQEVLEEAGEPLRRVDRLAATTGPGTFTGQRVGIAFMRGLKLALKKPLIGVTTLDAMLAEVSHTTTSNAVAVLHDAKRSEVYCAATVGGRSALPVSLLSFDAALDALAVLLPEDVTFAGTAAGAALEAWAALGKRGSANDTIYPDALWVARLALSAPEADGTARPLYLRAPDARLPPMAPIALEIAGPEQAHRIAPLHAACFDEAWSETSIARLLEPPGAFAFLIRVAARDVGFVIARVAADEAEIISIGVVPALARQGLAIKLLRRAAEECEARGAVRLFLEVGSCNVAARALYEKFGFTCVGRRPRYYGRASEDALVLRASLARHGLGNPADID